MRGVVTPIFGLLALAFLVLGLLNDTVWKPSDQVDASADVSGSRYIVTDAGVLNLPGRNTMISVGRSEANGKHGKGAEAQTGTDMCVAIGTAKDVNGWLSGAKYTRITGLSDWSTLSTASAKADGQPLGGSAVPFKQSDMWSSVVCGARNVKLNGGADDGQVAVVDLGSDSSSAQVRMRWDRTKLSNNTGPFYIAAAVLALVALLCASVLSLDAKQVKEHFQRRKRQKQIRAAEEVSVAEALTGSIQGLARNIRSSSGPGRHTSAAREQAQEAEAQRAAAAAEQAGPSIIDPTTNNIVARVAAKHTGASASTALIDRGLGGVPVGGSASLAGLASANGPRSKPVFGEETAETSVIDPRELETYLTRLSNEVPQPPSAPAQPPAPSAVPKPPAGVGHMSHGGLQSSDKVGK